MGGNGSVVRLYESELDELGVRRPAEGRQVVPLDHLLDQSGGARVVRARVDDHRVEEAEPSARDLAWYVERHRRLAGVRDAAEQHLLRQQLQAHPERNVAPITAA